MSEPFAITEEMRKNRETKINEYIDSINHNIQYAVENNWNECNFAIAEDSPFFDEVKRKFEQAGYRITYDGTIMW